MQPKSYWWLSGFFLSSETLADIQHLTLVDSSLKLYVTIIFFPVTFLFLYNPIISYFYQLLFLRILYTALKNMTPTKFQTSSPAIPYPGVS